MFKCLLLIVSVAATPAITRVVENKLFSCSAASSSLPQEFRCADGKGCVESIHKCDGVNDCPDGSDEASCFENFDHRPEPRRKRQAGGCKRSEWTCRDGTCISFDGKCDGAVDCPDRSDETQALCRNMQCQSNWFRCTYGACVDGTAPCNGIVECADSSDELLPRCKNETMEIQGRFKCNDGTVIDSADLCDGTPNCPDRSDETVASCADKTCPSYLFQCAYGACVDQGADCNGKQDCADGSDEADDLCNKILKPTGTTASTTGTGSVTPNPPRPGMCLLPAYPKHGTYEVSNEPNARPGQTSSSYVLTVSCQRGYGLVDADGGVDGNGTQQVYCVNGVWYSNVPDCVRFCKLTPDPSVNYMCQVPSTNGFRACNEYVAPGTTVKPVCNTPNYYSSEALAYMKCIAGSFDKVSVCKPGAIKNGTNITIIIKDKVEVYISGFTYGTDTVVVNVGNNTVVVDNNNSNTDNGNNVGNNNIILGRVNKTKDNNVDSTISPVDYDISEEYWRMGPFKKKN